MLLDARHGCGVDRGPRAREDPRPRHTYAAAAYAIAAHCAGILIVLEARLIHDAASLITQAERRLTISGCLSSSVGERAIRHANGTQEHAQSIGDYGRVH